MKVVSVTWTTSWAPKQNVGRVWGAYDVETACANVEKAPETSAMSKRRLRCLKDVSDVEKTSITSKRRLWRGKDATLTCKRSSKRAEQLEYRQQDVDSTLFATVFSTSILWHSTSQWRQSQHESSGVAKPIGPAVNFTSRQRSIVIAQSATVYIKKKT